MACTVGEVAVREIGFPDEPAAADSVAPEVTVATAVGSFEEVAGASQDMALALPSLPWPTSSSVLLVLVVSVLMTMLCNNSMPLIDCQS